MKFLNQIKKTNHLPLFTHGDESHSFISVSHFSPEYPGTQLQVNPFTWSVQFPVDEDFSE